MITRNIAICLLCLFVLFGVDSIWADLPAFPGAEGAGATATGGRGQTVYHVTNLSESGPGSFVDALSQSDRIVVFDVSGIITLNTPDPASGRNDHFFRVGRSNITIAGQTAPGNGIVIQGTGMKFTGSNVVMRHISTRPGIIWNDQVRTMDGLWLQTHDSIFDHISVAWASDEGISVSDSATNNAVQYCIIAEGLMNHSYGGLIGPDNSNIVVSLHHNLFANNKSRNPRIGNETGSTNVVDFRNNVLYNWQYNCGYSGDDQEGDVNFEGNYYIAGQSAYSWEINKAFSSGSTLTGIYQSGNKIDPDRDGVFNGTDTGWAMFSGPETQFSTPLPAPSVYTQTADDALQTVMNYSGANWWNRTSTDARLINIVLSAGIQGELIYDPSEVGGWPTEPVVYRPADWDTDQDGMPNTWEAAYGLDPNVANDNADFDSDGYTDIEEYINDWGAWPAPITLVFTNSNGNGRYAEIGNWGNVWQPSRFDAAQINSGTVQIDAVGQQARSLALATNSGSAATLQVTGGWIDIRETLSIGSVGTGSVTQSGGLVRAGTSVVIGNAGAAGTYTLSGGTLATPLLTKGNVSSNFNFTNGVLHADQVAFSLINNGGVIAPGSDEQLQKIAAASMLDINGDVEPVQSFVGNTHINGNLTLQSGSLQIDLASLTSFDTITVDGTLSLGGALEVVLDNGYQPSPGSYWLIGTAASITGNFSSISPDFDTEVLDNHLYLVTDGTRPPYFCTAPIASDLDGDCEVDFFDYAVFANVWATQSPQGDINGDTYVDLFDLAQLATDWLTCNRDPASECWQ